MVSAAPMKGRRGRGGGQHGRERSRPRLLHGRRTGGSRGREERHDRGDTVPGRCLRAGHRGADPYRYLTTRVAALPAIAHLETAPAIRTVRQAGEPGPGSLATARPGAAHAGATRRSSPASGASGPYGFGSG
ncbi:hypothetical protein SGPA1_21794 [Streptomyces misionensis JCM 4497]